MNSELAPDIVGILKMIGIRASLNGGSIPWQEQNRLKADMMNMWQYWVGVDELALKAKCVEVGISHESTQVLLDFFRKRKAGRRLVPASRYRNKHFRHDYKADSTKADKPFTPSFDW